MKTRMALVAVIAAVFSAISAPTPSFAVGNNNNATIDGVSSEPADEFVTCSSGEFCMFTRTNFGGRVFRMRRCGTYTMRNWNGYGSWFNYNDGGAHAYLKNSNRQTVLNISPEQYSTNYDFTPIWFVTPC